MATRSRYAIIDSVEQCRTAVDDLMAQEYVAVDAEGVNLGMTGPLTILQVAKADGFVYLFDTQTTDELFSEGRLKELLESEAVVKVMHASSNDSTALKCQFDVMLRNVFDIQAAHMVIEESNGKKLPSKQKLVEVCRLYGGDAAALEQKDDIQVKWNKTHGEYWAVRPLTTEMIEYATSDVRILIPGVYQSLKREIESRQLMQKYKETVHVELRYRWDDTTRDRKNAASNVIVDQILHNLARRFGSNRQVSPTKITDITDEDEIQALKRMKVEDAIKYPEPVRGLKYAFIDQELMELERELMQKGPDFAPSYSTFSFLRAVETKHPEARVVNKAKEVHGKIDRIVTEDIGVKYNMATPAEHITTNEKVLLQKMKPASRSDPGFNKVVLRLCWLLIDADVEKLDREMQEYRLNPRGFVVDDRLERRLKAQLYSVPIVRDKARAFLGILEKDGRVQRRRGTGRGTGRGQRRR